MSIANRKWFNYFIIHYSFIIYYSFLYILFIKVIWMTTLGRSFIYLGLVHTNPFSKRFSSTLIVFISFSPVHTTTPYPFWKRFYTPSAYAQMNSTHAHLNISAREVGAKLKPHGSFYPPFWIVTVEWSGARLVYFDDVTVFRWHRFRRPH